MDSSKMGRMAGPTGNSKSNRVVELMKNRQRRITAFVGIAFLGLAVCAADVPAAFIATVDGNLAEWGITVADNNGSTYTGMTNFSTGSLALGGSVLQYHLEDQNDNAGVDGFLGPNHGGQKYDAEFLGVVRNGTSVSIAIVTGQRPDNGLKYYSPGDIRIETSTGIYGIEVGGVPVSDTASIVDSLDPGITFDLKSNGYTKGAIDGLGAIHGTPSSSFAGPAGVQLAGSIWKAPTWMQDPISPPTDVQIQSVLGVPYAGLADYVYTLNSATTQHAIMELTFDAADMGHIHSVSWSPSCGNDVVHVNLPNPEPASLAIWAGIGLCAFATRFRRRRR